MAALSKILRVISRSIGVIVRSFALTLLLIDLLYGIALAGLAFWMTSDDSVVRGVVVALLTLSLTTAVGVFLATHVATLKALQHGISEAGLGRMIFEALFEKVEGWGLSSRRVSIGEVEKILNKAASQVLSEPTDSSEISGVLFWFARQIQRITVWATVRTIVRSCSQDGASVELDEVRAKLGGVIDELLVSFLKEFTFKLVIRTLGLVAAGVILLCQLVMKFG